MLYERITLQVFGFGYYIFLSRVLRVATHVLQVLHDSSLLMLAKQNFKHSSKQKAQYLRSVQFRIVYIITNEQSIHMVREVEREGQLIKLAVL